MVLYMMVLLSYLSLLLYGICLSSVRFIAFHYSILNITDMFLCLRYPIYSIYCISNIIHWVLHLWCVIFVLGLADFIYPLLKSSEYLYDHYFKFSITHITCFTYISCCDVCPFLSFETFSSISSICLSLCIFFFVLGKSATSSALNVVTLQRSPIVLHS